MRFCLFILAVLMCGTLHAQTQQQNSGWFLFLNNTKINKKWGAYFDMQVRSAHQWENVRHLLLRPGITYYASEKHELTLGYLLNDTFTHIEGASNNTLTEHRIWEQYVFKHKLLRNVSAAHRFRLEQRFIERQGKDELFAQRLRYFVRFIIPLEKGIKSFEEGVFVALQNELFFNVQHKNELNHQFFDQNRAYAAAGYRFNKHLDIEAGYLNQFIKGLENKTFNNVIQLAVYTKF
jgi:hypothetical protein